MSSRPCCSVPHGNFSLVALIFSVFAFITSRLYQTSCSYIRVGAYLFSEDGTGLGLLYREGYYWEGLNLYRACVYYDSDERDDFDASWRAAIAMSSLSTVFGGVGVIILFSALCIAYNSGMFKMVGGFFVFSSMCDMLSLVALNSKFCTNSQNCNMGYGAGLAIASSIMYLITAFATCKIPNAEPLEKSTYIPATPEPAEALAPGTVQTTTTIAPDGTRTTMTVETAGAEKAEQPVEKIEDEVEVQP